MLEKSFDNPIHRILFSFITGVQGRIQVPERCMHVLSEWYTFEMRGSIFVKGKDHMTTFLLIGRKPDSFVNAVSSIVPQYAAPNNCSN